MRQYLGIPYKDFGRTKKGLDCWGLCIIVAKEQFNYDLPLLLGRYESASNGESVSELVEIEKLNQWVKVTEYKAGDIAVFAVCGLPCHVAICLDTKTFMHVLEGTEVTIEKFDSILWKNRLDGVYRRCKT